MSALPSLLDAAIDRWDLDLGEPFRNGSAAWVAPVIRRMDGTEAVLKITLPHREARHEGEGLRVWNGEGSVGLLEEDADDYILLLERCRPGSQLRVDSSPAEELLVIGASSSTDSGGPPCLRTVRSRPWTKSVGSGQP